MASKDGKVKLYEVIKALSAMRLCKEDSAPSPILSRKKKDDGTLDTEIIPSPHPPKPDRTPEEIVKAEEQKLELNETTISKDGGATLDNSEGCLF